jgi:hypothetical protein
VASNVCQCISDTKKYSDVISISGSLYIKQRNEIFARHCLASRNKQVGESINEYLRVLKQMSKDCNFKRVSAELYESEDIRDASIRGLRCPRIRRRLLENAAVNLEAAFDQARTSEFAELHSASYPSLLDPTTTAAMGKHEEEVDENLSLTTAAASSKMEKCFFCGSHRHPRILCPAKEAICSLCIKKGHYQRVCMSRPNKSLQNPTAACHMLASVSVVAPCCLQISIVKGKGNGVELNALIDTGSSLSFINQSLVKKCGIQVVPYFGRILVGNFSMLSEIKGHCKVVVEMEGYTCNDIEMLILKNLVF